MVETLDLSEVLDRADSLYEAVMLVAKRARQINEEQRSLTQRNLMIQTEVDSPADLEELEEEELSPPEPIQDYLRLPRPAVVAMKEVLEGKVHFRYIGDELEED